MHVEDLVDAHMLALEKLDSFDGFNVYNIGSGKGYSVLEIFSKVKEIMKSDKEFVMSDRRPGDPDSLLADIGKAGKELNWKPKRNLDEIIKSAVKFHTNENK